MVGGSLDTTEALLAWVEASSTRDEQTLRNQVPDGDLGTVAENQLRLLKSDAKPLFRTLRTWAYLKHLFWAASEGLGKSNEGKEEAVHQLLTRQPLQVDIGTRVVTLTGRSYQAMYEIARHSVRLREIVLDVDRCARMEHRCLADMEAGGDRRSLARARRHFHRVTRIHQELYAEAALNRQALYAHVFTADGGPAASIDEAPEWWTEIDGEADLALMRGVWEVGGGRYSRLGEPPAAGETGKAPAESFGWHTHFARLERTMKIPAARAAREDFYQRLAWLRAAADAPLDEDLGE